MSAIVVDDEPAIQEIMTEMLSILGVDIVGTGSNGNEAISLYQENSPSVVFMDINMPKLNGVEALKEIKKIDPKSAVIMVTGNTENDLESTLMALGAKAIIYKPFSVEQLKEIIEFVNNSSTIIQNIQSNNT